VSYVRSQHIASLSRGFGQGRRRCWIHSRRSAQSITCVNIRQLGCG
jgi:hypothetical protein